MCSNRKYEYRIEPAATFEILRNCAGCGRKTEYCSTGNFRVNANGRKVDVWLIYQCKKCRHTCNLTVYERRNPTTIPQKEYEAFLRNDADLAAAYGRSREFFLKNRAELVPGEQEYKLISLQGGKRQEPLEKSSEEPFPELVPSQLQAGDVIILQDPYSCRIRSEKVLARLTGLSVSRVRKLEKEGFLVIETDYAQRRSMIQILLAFDGYNRPISIKGATK